MMEPQIGGYGALAYGESFREIGDILTLPSSGLQVIVRPIDGKQSDVAGIYPFSICREWARVVDDERYLRDLRAVSITLVGDPFDESVIRRELSGWDVCRPLKTHFVVDLAKDWRTQRSKKVRYYTRKALEFHEMEIVRRQCFRSKEFWPLYEHLIARHGVTGIQRMSPSIIERHLSLEDAVLILAKSCGSLLGALICMRQDQHAHFHLMAISEEGYRRLTSYALTFAALEFFEKQGTSFVNLGGSAGLVDDPNDGLYRFKRRWSNTTRTSTLCGKILSPSAYAKLAGSVRADSSFFPAYRAPMNKTGEKLS